MKKSLLLVSIILFTIALLPLVGNKFLKSMIDTELEKLDTSSFKIQKDVSKSNYLKTSRHLEINIEKNGSNTLVGFDIKYNNLPFTKALELEIYPLSLPSNISQDIKKSNSNLYKKLEELIKARVFIYTVTYNLIDKKFKASLRDINEKIAIDVNTTITLVIKKSILQGHLQNDLSVDKLLTTIKELFIKVEDKQEKVSFSLQKGSYKYSSQKKHEEIDSHTSIVIKKLSLDSKKVLFEIKDAKMIFFVSGMNADIYTDIARAENENELHELLIQLFSKGLQIDIEKLYAKTIILNKTENLQGFELKSTIEIKKDDFLAQKMAISPLLVLGDFNLDLNILISNEIYKKITKSSIMNPLYIKYLQQDAKNVRLDLQYQDSKVTINGKRIY